MIAEAPSEKDAPLVVPVFPLPNTVLFPRTSLPLHIFEPRYRAMVWDVSAGDGRIVIALMSRHGFADLGTVGRIRDLEPLPDGKFNLTLEGIERAALVEVEGDTPYRRVRIEPRPERAGTDDPVAIAEARLQVLASFGALRSIVQGNEPLVLHQDLPFDVIVNTVCGALPVEAALRQRLLAEDSLIERHRRALEYLSAVIDALSWLRATRDNDGSAAN